MTRVAVVDDGEVVRDAIVDLLVAEPDIEVAWTARDPDEAIANAARDAPEVVLVDVRMPNGGGPRAAREILRAHPHVQVVGLSAYGERATVMEMLQAGAVGYVLKGSSADEIIAAVAAAAEGGTMLSPEVSGEVVRELADRLIREARDEQRVKEIQSRVGRALRDREALAIHFQPVFDLADLRIVGVEALARFPSEPDVPPEAWFADAEEVGQRLELELEAARRAFRMLPELPDDLHCSINASPATVLGEEFRAMVASSAGRRLVVEITEHAVVEDYGAMATVAEEIRAGGGRLAVDDVGAGFASLRHILRLSPDVIKIDRSLTAGVDGNPGARALTRALVAFAGASGAEVVAEGIERPEEVDALRGLGVSLGQGFHLGRAVELTELLTLLDR